MEVILNDQDKSCILFLADLLRTRCLQMSGVATQVTSFRALDITFLSSIVDLPWDLCWLDDAHDISTKMLDTHFYLLLLRKLNQFFGLSEVIDPVQVQPQSVVVRIAGSA